MLPSIRFILSNDPAPYGVGYRLLSAAISEDRIALVRELIAAGVDVNKCNPMGTCPLTVAVMLGRTDVVSLLLANGANPDGSPSQDYSPLGEAHSRNDLTIIQLLLCHGATYQVARLYGPGTSHNKNTYWIHNPMSNHPDPLDEPRADGYLMSFWYSDMHKASILACAMYERRYALFTELLRAGAPTNYQEADGYSTLAVAVRRGDLVAMSLLLAYRASVNGIANQPQTPLMVALETKNPQAIAMLLAHGADPTEAIGLHESGTIQIESETLELLKRFC